MGLFRYFISFVILLPTIVGLCAAQGRSADAPFVHEITMATPDIVRVEIREQPLRAGRIEPLAGSYETVADNWMRLADGRVGRVIGAKADHVRIADIDTRIPLDRQAIDHTDDYPPISNRTVTGVYRKSVPWNSGTVAKSLPHGLPVASFKHFIYLKLDGPLAPGQHEIAFPNDTVASATFTFDDARTRASSIRTTLHGHHPDDEAKYAYLALWLPYGPDDGAVDFRTYGINEFHVIDSQGRTVFTAPIHLRMGPRTLEKGNGISNTLITYKDNTGRQYEANRSGTFVFGLDYGAWRPAEPGAYRLRIPGLGVSDTFRIDAEVWRDAAQTAMAGLYHQRSGIELDGRFGYARPADHRPTPDTPIRQSLMPFAFSKESGTGIYKFADAAKPEWLTARIVDDAWGGYHDAGDWDRRIQHLGVSNLLLDVFELTRGSMGEAEFGTPSSAEALGLEPFKGKDFPDLVDEAVWGIDLFRCLQRDDGAVSGGVEAASGPAKWEPSWLSSSPAFVYAPDPVSTYTYAAVAAKLAVVLREQDEMALSDLYRDSALKAWRWADQAASDPIMAFGPAMARLDRKNESVAKMLDRIAGRTRTNRVWAAAALYRLTGEVEFNQVFLDGVDRKPQHPLGPVGDAMWEYSLARHSSADHALQVRMREKIIDTARRFLVIPKDNDVTYRNMKIAGAPFWWGTANAPDEGATRLLIRAHALTGDIRIFRAMLNGSAHILGANQVGMSFTAGLGGRTFGGVLHEDTIAAGLPAPRGVTVYGWARPHLTNYNWVWGPKWAVLSDQVREKRVEPERWYMPVYEYVIEHPHILMTAEYTVHQTIGTTAAMWSYLAGVRR